MELLEYKRIMQDFAIPTIGQTENFIDFIARDHSWYKHLPEDRLEPFFFYLDPNAGRPLCKVEEKGLFRRKKYYSFKEVSSNSYQRYYGTWHYYTNKYTVNFIPQEDNSIRDSRPFIGLNIINGKGEAQKIPEEVITQGKFMMSKFLHKRAFKDTHNFYDSNGISFAENHKILVADLKQHLCSFLSFIYDT
jgi:hypothetical protein